MNNLEQTTESLYQEVNPALFNGDLEGAAPDENEVHPMEQLLSENEFTFREFEVGEMIEGVIVGVTNNEVLVDIGSKSEGVIPARDLDRVDEENRAKLQVGNTVIVQVVRPESRDGNAILSFSRALQEYDWKRAEELLESQEIFEGEVSGYNKGGVIVYLGKARGFVPASQLVSDEGRKSGDQEDRFSSMVGKKLWLKVIELDRSRNRLILSERQAERERRRIQKEQLLNSLQVGEVRTGRIRSIASFGAFVDLGGADGLIHLSELSWKRVTDPTEVVQVGDEVEVKVISVDRERRRIGLSLRQLQPEPWSVVHENYAIGQLVEAEITRLTSFGAFARVDGMIEGLIHVSELSDKRVSHPKEVVREGQKLTLRIIKIEPEKRRMGLSLKRVAEEEYATVTWAPEEEEETEPTAMAVAMAEAEETAALEQAQASSTEVEEEEIEEPASESESDAAMVAEAEVEAEAETATEPAAEVESATEVEVEAEPAAEAEVEVVAG
ncbi:MAG: S1 RNA-binding domain-containing protein [Chloroflexi bacterium]|nr:S1 RNA-binding domain-containing protein [Chloroflexota bacterium]